MPVVNKNGDSAIAAVAPVLEDVPGMLLNAGQANTRFSVRIFMRLRLPAGCAGICLGLRIPANAGANSFPLTTWNFACLDSTGFVMAGVVKKWNRPAELLPPFAGVDYALIQPPSGEECDMRAWIDGALRTGAGSTHEVAVLAARVSGDAGPAPIILDDSRLEIL